MSAHPPLWLATGNIHKVQEFCQLLTPLGLDIVCAPAGFAPEETGTTFQENARIKAQALCTLWHHNHGSGPAPLFVADDSGLVVQALAGAPGVSSARYATPLEPLHPAYDQDQANRDKLLRAMEEVPKQHRGAFFVCVLCLFTHASPPRYFEGVVHGTIAKAPLGTTGFGYDALFVPEGSTETFAELGPKAKARLSHRSRAVAALARALKPKD